MAALHWRRRQVVRSFAAAGLLPMLARAEGETARVAAAVERAFAPLVSAHDLPGLSVGVTLGGRRHVFHHGVASRESGAPVNDGTIFEIGSLSKAFTGTLAAYAQAMGRLSLDDSPARFMPALRGTALEAARLLHLATYTAGGLPLQFPDDIDTPATATAYYRQWKPDAPPGVQRRYSNPSIGLLGHVTALAMEREFADLAESELFRRLGLRSTFVRVPASHQAAYAWGYNKSNQPIRVNPGVFDAEAYGVKSTVGDLLRFVEANLDPTALDPALRRAIAATHVGRFRVGPMVQGLGWEQYPFPVPLDRLQAGNAGTMALHPQAATAIEPAQAPAVATLFNKTGSTNGFAAYAVFVPARRAGLVMLANRNFPIPARVAAAHAVLEQVLGV